MSRILDPRFKYVPAAKTNVAATFKRIRAEQKRNAEEAQEKVKPIVRSKVA